MMIGYDCPTVPMTLKGQQGQHYLDKGSAFYYVVNSCPSMNRIKEKLGVDTLVCKGAEEIQAAVGNITVEVKVINASFDAKQYSEYSKMDYV